MPYGHPAARRQQAKPKQVNQDFGPTSFLCLRSALQALSLLSLSLSPSLSLFSRPSVGPGLDLRGGRQQCERRCGATYLAGFRLAQRYALDAGLTCTRHFHLLRRARLLGNCTGLDEVHIFGTLHVSSPVSSDAARSRRRLGSLDIVPHGPIVHTRPPNCTTWPFEGPPESNWGMITRLQPRHRHIEPPLHGPAREEIKQMGSFWPPKSHLSTPRTRWVHLGRVWVTWAPQMRMR